MNSEKNLDCTDLFLEDINLLKKYRNIMWSSKATTSFIIEIFEDLPELFLNRLKFKDYVSYELYEQYKKEYQMTIILLEKWLIAAENKGNILTKGETILRVNTILEKIKDIKDSIDENAIIEFLREEDPTTRKALECLGLNEKQIQKAIKNGFKAESILDLEQEPTLK